MNRVIDLTKHIIKKRAALQLSEAEKGGLDLYDDALEVLDSLLSMQNGEIMMFWMIDGELLSRKINNHRFQINPEELQQDSS